MVHAIPSAMGSHLLGVWCNQKKIFIEAHKASVPSAYPMIGKMILTANRPHFPQSANGIIIRYNKPARIGVSSRERIYARISIADGKLKSARRQ
jgi:hypothetical protein